MKLIKPEDKNRMMGKLTAARTALLLKAPFYGTLLMHLKFGLAPCETACTDMKRILWDPQFLERLSGEEVKFVLLHEVMHCVLEHVCRGKGKIFCLYNVAADIVVNSSILEVYGADDFSVDGEKVMHTAPDGKEGREYTAEQVYEMLLKKYESLMDDADTLENVTAGEYGTGMDSHNIWASVSADSEGMEEWKSYVREAAGKFGSMNGSLPFVRKLLERGDYSPVLDWRQILQDFIQLAADSYDFSFIPADRRFSDGDFILPSFHEAYGDKIENIWMLIDTSGSIDSKMLSDVVDEIKASVSQFSSLKAKLSFFDTKVTDPVEFEEEEDLENVRIKGGGGTSFYSIFEYLSSNMCDSPPAAIVIITDGHARYPDEKNALGIPVLWILTDDDQDAPWGKSIHVKL